MLAGPLLACSGVGSGPESAIQGDWRVWPDKAEQRKLRILELALNKKDNTAQLAKMKPPATDEEKEMYKSLHTLFLDDPKNMILLAAKSELQMLKHSTLSIDGDRFEFDMGADQIKGTFNVVSSSGKSLTAEVDGETFVFEFPPKTNDMMQMAPAGEDPIRFKRR